MSMKICSTCKIKKNLNEFSNSKRTKDGKQYICKICRKEYYKNNIEHVKNCNKKWEQNNPDKIRIKNHTKRAARNNWGKSKPLNSYFIGSHLHHLHSGTDHQIAIYIPEKLHRSIYHSSQDPIAMFAINELAIGWWLSNTY